jgi:hypothetical protein
MNINKIRIRLLCDGLFRPTAFLLGIYAFACGVNLPYASQVGMNACEFVLYMITDHYYLIYAWLFYLVFVTAKQATNKRLIERIRYNTTIEYYLYCFAVALIRLTFVITTHILISMAVACMRLRFSNNFGVSAAASMNVPDLEVLEAYAGQFNNPFLAIGAAGVWWLIGSTFFCVILLLSYELWNNKGFIACTCMLLVFVMIGFITELDEGPMGFLLFNNCYILHHALANKCILAVLMYEISSCIAMLTLGRSRLRNSLFRREVSLDG